MASLKAARYHRLEGFAAVMIALFHPAFRDLVIL